jgi:hypothetical protein
MKRAGLILAAFTFLAWSAAGAEPVRHRIMFAEYGKGLNRLVELDGDGKIVWEHRPPSIAVIFQVLPGGHVLYAYGGKPTGVQEVDRDHKVVWDYQSRCPQVLGCERLPGGNTLLGEQGPCRAVEVSPKGEVVRITLPVRNTLRNTSQAFFGAATESQNLVTGLDGPGIEGFSRTRARNGVLRCFDRSRNWPEHSSELDVAVLTHRRDFGHW